MIKPNDIPRIMKAYEELKAKYPKKRAIVYFLALNFKYTEKEIRGILPERPLKARKVTKPVLTPKLPEKRLCASAPGENYRDIVNYLWAKFEEEKKNYSTEVVWDIIDTKHFPFPARTGDPYQLWKLAITNCKKLELLRKDKSLTTEVPYKVRALA